MAATNARLLQIADRNAEAERQIARYRAEATRGPVDRRELAKRQQAAPWFGILPCEAAGIEFVMLHAHDDVVARDYLWKGPDGYEPEMVRTWVDWCRTPGTVLDIGAYSGLMAILAARAHGDNVVHLFEPMERTVERANVNIKLNGLGPRIARHAVAASDRAGSAEICLYRDADFLGTGNSLYVKEARPVVDRKTIQTARLDDLFPDLAPDVVKIDVEGHELATLRGMEAMLVRGRPKLLIEVWAHTRVETLSMLDNLGYDAERVEAVARDVENYIALPKARGAQRAA